MDPLSFLLYAQAIGPIEYFGYLMRGTARNPRFVFSLTPVFFSRWALGITTSRLPQGWSWLVPTLR